MRAPPPARLLVADEREHDLAAPGIAELRQGDEREHQGGHARLHVAGAAPVDAPVLQIRPQRRVRPPGLADRKGVEVAVEHEPSAGTRPSCPRDEIDGRRPADHAAMLDAAHGVEHRLDRFDNGGGIARRIDAVDPRRRPEQIDECAGPRLHARRETRLLDAEAHIRENRGDIVDSAARLRIAQQIESRQRGRRDLHRAGVGLAALDSCRHRFHLLAETEDDQVAARADRWKTLVRDDLKLQDRLIHRAVQLRRLEETDATGLTRAAHERIDVPGRWRCPPGRTWSANAPYTASADSPSRSRISPVASCARVISGGISRSG